METFTVYIHFWALSTMHHLCWTLFYSSCILFYSAFSSFEPFLQCISFARHFLQCIRSTGSNSVYHTPLLGSFYSASPVLSPVVRVPIPSIGSFLLYVYPHRWTLSTVSPVLGHSNSYSYSVQHTLSRRYWMMALPKSTGSLSTELRYLRWASRQSKWALCTHTYHHTVQ